ncbi:MAG: hypothetical protein E6L03_10445 [Thaumarchaeota archaeon]|nr:MAG: hypothetical protein E6L03_10445 [Nitrososphaerota archaeon]
MEEQIQHVYGNCPCGKYHPRPNETTPYQDFRTLAIMVWKAIPPRAMPWLFLGLGLFVIITASAIPIEFLRNDFQLFGVGLIVVGFLFFPRKGR